MNMQDQPHRRHDGYINMLTKVGTAKDSTEAYVYAYEPPTPDVELAQIYESNGLFAKIIDKPAELAFKNGYNVKINDPDIEQFIMDSLEKLRFKECGVRATKWSRLFGGSAILMSIDDGGDLDEPLNWDAIRGIDKLIVFERPEITPDYQSLYSYTPDRVTFDKFGEPEYYLITPVYGGQQFRVHESRLLIFKNGDLPRSCTTNTEYMFFGAPEYNRIKRELRDTITSHGNGYRLLERCVQAVYKMKNLAATLATEKGENEVITRMQLIDMARSLINTMVIDAEGEDYSFQTFQMGGVKDIMDESCAMLSAVTHIPQTVLFGRSPAGMNSTGESDLANYYDYVGQIQEPMIRDNLITVIDIILAAGKAKGNIPGEIPEYTVEFKPLWNKTEKEQAELEQAKATAALTKAQAAQIYVDIQALDSVEIRRSLAKEESYDIEDVITEEDDLDIAEILEQMGAGQESYETENTAATAEGVRPAGEMQAEALPRGDPGMKPQNMDDNEPEYDQGAAVLVIHGGRILCGERDDGGGLCGPGGKVESGETPEEAALREAKEEFGITPLNILPLGEYEGSPGLYLPSTVYFTDRFRGSPEADREEMKNARWLTLEELIQEKLFPPFEASIQMLLKLLEGKEGDGNG